MSYGRELSPQTIHRAEMSQKLESVPVVGLGYRALRHLVAGSSSPAFQPAQWQTADFVKGVDGSDSPWIVGRTNSEAGYFPRTWNKVIVLRATKEAFEEVLEENIGNAYDVRSAVAYRYGGEIHVGVTDTGLTELWGNYVGSLRQGRRPIEATIGLYEVEQKSLWIPRGVEMARDLLPIRDFPKFFPSASFS